MSDRPPDDKDNLIEMLKRYGALIGGIIGLFTAIYNLYQLWTGDQTAVTYIAAGVGLVILVIALAWIGFKTKEVEIKTVVTRKDQTETTRIEKQPAYLLKYRRLAQGGLILILIGMLLGGNSLFQQRQATQTEEKVAQLQATQRALETQQAQQEIEEKLVVVIAAFDGPEDDYGLRNQILEELNASFKDSEDVIITPTSNIITPVEGSDYARKLGQSKSAKIVIWGWYRSTDNPNITIHIENLSPEKTLPITESTMFKPSIALEDLDSFTFQQQAGQETSSLISFLVGYLYFQTGDYNNAIPNFDKAYNTLQSPSKLYEIEAGIHLYRGNAKLFLGLHDEAIADYDKALELYPNNVNTITLDPKSWTFYNRGLANLLIKQYQNAIYDFDKAIDLFPDFPAAYTNRGLAYFQLEQYEQAIADYNIAIKLIPGFPPAFNNRGLVYFQLEQYEQAMADLDKAIQSYPKYALSYFNRGGVHYSLGNFDLAIIEFNKAIEINPDFAEAYNNRGIVYFDQKQYQLSIADYNRAIEINSKIVQAYNNLGNVYMALNQYDRAIVEYDKAIEVDPDYSDPYYNRGVVYHTQKQYDRAILDYNKTIEIDPYYIDAYNNRGIAYYEQGQYEPAIADYNKAIELDENFSAAYYNRANVYSVLEQYDDAIKDYDRAIELDPNDIRTYLNRGRAYYGLEEYELAIADANKAIEIDPNYANSYRARGYAYQALGKAAEAEADFKKYEELTGEKP